MLKIGDFAKLTRLSVQTLRYYDDLGLLKPVEVDRYTGYRYYTYDQLPRLNRILALKDLGLSLEQVGRLLAEDLPAAELRGMLRLKRAELRASHTLTRMSRPSKPYLMVCGPLIWLMLASSVKVLNPLRRWSSPPRPL